MNQPHRIRGMVNPFGRHDELQCSGCGTWLPITPELEGTGTAACAPCKMRYAEIPLPQPLRESKEVDWRVYDA